MWPAWTPEARWRRGVSVQPEQGEKGGVDAPLLLRTYVPGKRPEPRDVNRSGLFDQDACGRAVDVDLGSKGSRFRSRRRRGYQHN